MRRIIKKTDMESDTAPYFSVIVPVYNTVKYIGRCLDSLNGQSFEDYEVIIVDDGSEDGGGLICDEYVKKYPGKFRVYHIKNGGVSAARNYGLSYAKGKLVTFVDSDDTVERGYLETFYQMPGLEEDIDLAVCGLKIAGKNIVLNGSQDKNGIFNRDQLLEELVKRNSFGGYLVNKAFRREILIQYGIMFDVRAHMCEDLLFCVRYALHVRKAYFKNAPNYEYVQRGESVTHQHFNAKRITVLKTYEEIIDIISGHGTAEALKTVKVNFWLHNISVYLMVRKRAGYEETALNTKKYIRSHMCFMKSEEIGCKPKLKALFACLLTYM